MSKPIPKPHGTWAAECFEIWGLADGFPMLMCEPERVKANLAMCDEQDEMIHLCTVVVPFWDDAKEVYDSMWAQDFAEESELHNER